jgi:hypothetical protein
LAFFLFLFLLFPNHGFGWLTTGSTRPFLLVTRDLLKVNYFEIYTAKLRLNADLFCLDYIAGPSGGRLPLGTMK